ncbi:MULTISPECIES: SDR family oxidoreductase [Nitrincola]|uniref:3-oxoacyl-[acyl-carrier-protein] reductase FabG n=1 Tax=Nitrincola nitratireducens TaxID=1229521 RepID=W9UY45_9GAMM|nr:MULTISPECIES: SDR family oxidoreductase [Nitrincola]EXJ09646.1 3-oxoacyl-[acyl-carrier-protein] reductase FabG [Nitrincola nitratireducens]
MQIHNKTFVITGGARGLGAGMAVHLAKLGANVALIDLDAEGLQHTADELVALGVKSQGYVCDITDEGQVESTFASIRADFGQIHGLVNNAGLMRDGMLIKIKDGKLVDKMSLSQWSSVVSVNLTGAFLCGREAAAIMAEQGEGGVIVNVSSVSRAGNAGQTNYSATKSGVATLVVSWAKELARYGIRVGGIAPGVIATEMTAQMKPEAIERMLSAVPLRRLGEISEMAHTLQYIVENDFFTGRIIEMDGGLRI